MQILRKLLFYTHYTAKSDENCYFTVKYQGSCHITHTLWQNQMKIITLNAYSKEIVMLHTF